MIEWIKNWRKTRGEKLCSLDKHDWKPCPPPLDKMGHGNAFALNLMMSMHYKYARCTRCGKLGRK